jgi:hypothetical protein
LSPEPSAAADAAVKVSKAVVWADFVKNNRVELLICAVLAHLVGWTGQATEYVSGMC